jgi:hypothetical protein
VRFEGRKLCRADVNECRRRQKLLGRGKLMNEKESSVITPFSGRLIISSCLAKVFLVQAMGIVNSRDVMRIKSGIWRDERQRLRSFFDD